MDTTLTQQEEQQINDAIDAYAAQKGLPGGAKEIFCEYWLTAKQVLEFLKSILPGPIPAVIGIIIKFGDIAHGKICEA